MGDQGQAQEVWGRSSARLGVQPARLPRRPAHLPLAAPDSRRLRRQRARGAAAGIPQRPRAAISACRRPAPRQLPPRCIPTCPSASAGHPDLPLRLRRASHPCRPRAQRPLLPASGAVCSCPRSSFCGAHSWPAGRRRGRHSCIRVRAPALGGAGTARCACRQNSCDRTLSGLGPLLPPRTFTPRDARPPRPTPLSPDRLHCTAPIKSASMPACSAPPPLRRNGHLPLGHAKPRRCLAGLDWHDRAPVKNLTSMLSARRILAVLIVWCISARSCPPACRGVNLATTGWPATLEARIRGGRREAGSPRPGRPVREGRLGCHDQRP